MDGGEGERERDKEGGRERKRVEEDGSLDSLMDECQFPIAHSS